MNINSSSLFNEMQGMISKTQMSAPAMESLGVAKPGGADFSSMLHSKTIKLNAKCN